MAIRTATLALLCGAVALAAGGCGAGTSATLDPVAQAADATVNSGGAHAKLTIQVNLNGADGITSPIALTAQGDMNLAHAEGELIMNMGGLAALSHDQLPANATMTELYTHGSVYVGSSLLAGKLPGGARWLRIDLLKVAGQLDLEPQALTSGESNPTEFLQYLKAMGGSAHADGSATIRGVATTRYVGSIDLREAAKLLPSRDRAATEAGYAKLLEHFSSPDLPVEVWIDAHHMVRKLVMSMDMQEEGHAIDMTIDEELFDFGPTPGVNAPAASETYEVSPSALSSAAGVG